MKPFNPYAFPLAETPYAERQDGMSLRDWFAGQAIIGLLTSGLGTPLDVVTSAAFEVADAMLAEREKEKNK